MEIRYIQTNYHPEITTLFFETLNGKDNCNFSFNTSSENILKEDDKTYLKLEIEPIGNKFK